MEVGLIMLAGGLVAGSLGSLLGLGGGILIVPLLTLGFELPLRDAVGVSLVCVVATSAASAGVFLERGMADLRLAMRLELFSAVGAVVGGLVAFALDERLLAGLFAGLMLYVAFTMIRRAIHPGEEAAEASTAGTERPRRFTVGAIGSVGGGVLSALLGIGGGALMVPLMHLVMGLPLRVAAATSGLMIGVTAAASGIVYLLKGGIDPYVLGPTAVGVFAGAMGMSRAAGRVDVRVLRGAFVVVLLYIAARMALRALAQS